MDDNELKHALHKYVTSDEPPMGITADALLALGRRRQRIRLGASLGAGSAAAAITIAGTLVLGPFGGDSGPPVLQPASCTDGWRAVLSPPAFPSIDAHERPPFTEPSLLSTPSGSADPTYSPGPSGTAEPTYFPGPSGTAEPTHFPGPSGSAEPTPDATVDPTPAPTTAQSEADAMVCHLVAEIERIYPGSRLTGVEPISVIWYGGDGFKDSWAVGTGITFRHNGKEHRIDALVQPVFGFDRGRFPGLTCQTRETRQTAIRACSTGDITREQLAELVSGRELELFG